VLLGNLVAATIGITRGYFRGRYDIVVQRLVDAWQSFPYLIIILSLLAAIGG
jgi:peptide/nickel transport system permease protein